MALAPATALTLGVAVVEQSPTRPIRAERLQGLSPTWKGYRRMTRLEKGTVRV
jgi:hypothetical protein